VLSLAALGDMRLKPCPPARVRAEVGKIFPGRRFVWLSQEHTKTVRLAAPGVRGLIGDGLVSSDPRVVIGVSVADCMPVFLWDTALGCRAALHSGWKGTGIVREALRVMKTSFGSSPRNIRAILGPSIRACCYAVPEERAVLFAAEFGAEAAFLRGGAWYIDLAAANARMLAEEGIESVYLHPECTCCDSRFSSYRRQGRAFTRMLTLCGV
jgi:YfiH family protein